MAIVVPNPSYRRPSGRRRLSGRTALFRLPVLLGLGLVLAVFLCYIPAIGAGFVWDDDLLVTENPLVKNADSLPYIWATAAATDYTPLTSTVFWLQWHLWGDNATGYHVINILFHALSALLLWRLLARLDIPGAWLGALLFAVHPVNAASVAWIAELKNSLSLPFYLASVTATLHYTETRKASAALLAITAAACAFLCKGSTVILPLILMLCVWWRNGRGAVRVILPIVTDRRRCGGRNHSFSGPCHRSRGSSSSACGAFRPRRPGDLVLSRQGSMACRSRAHLSKVDRRSHVHAPAAAVALTAVLWVGRGRWGRGPFFAWAGFALPLLPVLGIIDMSFLDQAWAADWWQQLALPAMASTAGAIFAIGWRCMQGQPQRIAIAVLAASAALFLGSRTWAEASAYQSMESLCRRALASNPDAWSAHNNLGDVFSAEGRLDDAAVEYRMALRIKPGNSSAHSNLGVILTREGRLDEAISEYRAALAIEPGSPKGWFNLANALRTSDRNAEALDAFGKAIDEDARWIAPRYELGSLLLDLNQPAQAGRQAETIVHLDPTSLSGHYLLGRAAAGVGRFDVATAEMRTAIDIAGQGADQATIARLRAALAACAAGRIPAAPSGH